MKFLPVFLALFLVVSGTWTPSTKEDYLNYRLECYKEKKLTEDQFEKIKKHEFSHDHDTYCYIRCVGMKLGTWDDKKGYDIDRTYETLKAHNFDATKEDISKCFNEIMDVDTCTWAALNWMCIWEKKYITKKN